MSDLTHALITGLIASITTLIMTKVVFPDPLLNQAREAIEQCEQSLPRDKHCVLTAIEEK